MSTDRDSTSQTGVPPAGEDWLDRALRAEADDYVADNGFTARVMDALPPPAAPPAWRRRALTALWAVAGIALAFSLPGAVTDVTREVFRLLAAQPVSLSGIAVAVFTMCAITWATSAIALRRE
jgi:hypothetical protein